MWSTPSRCSEASHAARTYSGLPLMPTRVPSGWRSLPNLVASWTSSRAAGDGLADELLVGEGAVHVGGVEEADAEVEGPVDGVDALLLVRRAVELAHPHAAEAEGRRRSGHRGLRCWIVMSTESTPWSALEVRRARTAPFVEVDLDVDGAEVGGGPRRAGAAPARGGRAAARAAPPRCRHRPGPARRTP